MPKVGRWIDFTLVKRDADFEQVLRACGVDQFRRSGPSQLKALCPFHEDTKPSLSVNVGDNVFNCFGCGAKGDVIDFVAEHDQTSKPEAAHRIAKICGLDARVGETPPERRRGAHEPRGGPRGTEAAEAAVKAPEKRAAPGESVNQPLTFELKLDPRHPYLRSRGAWLTRELVDTFGLGFCSRGSMKGRICIPIHNERGELIAYAGRWPDAEPPSDEEKYRLPYRFQKNLVLFNHHRAALHGGAHVVLLEGYFGAMRLEALHIAAVATMGSSVSTEQIELLAARWPLVTVLFDGDKPGREAADAAALPLAERLSVHVARLPEGTEPDTVDEDVLRELLNEW